MNCYAKKLCLSAAAVTAGAALAFLSTQPAIVNPPPIVHVGFVDASGNWITNDAWTNYFGLTVLLSSNLTDWQATNPPLEIYHGHLCFGIPADAPQQFCRAMFTPTNQ